LRFFPINDKSKYFIESEELQGEDISEGELDEENEKIDEGENCKEESKIKQEEESAEEGELDNLEEGEIIDSDDGIPEIKVFKEILNLAYMKHFYNSFRFLL